MKLGDALIRIQGRGIGRAIALRLADDGFDVAVTDISTADLGGLVEEIRSKQRKSSFYVTDVSIEEQVKGLIKKVVELHGSLDVVSSSGGLRLNSA